jgi:hypothetical protein
MLKDLDVEGSKILKLFLQDKVQDYGLDSFSPRKDLMAVVGDDSSGSRIIAEWVTASVVKWLEFLAVRPDDSGSIPGATRFSE